MLPNIYSSKPLTSTSSTGARIVHVPSEIPWASQISILNQLPY